MITKIPESVVSAVMAGKLVLCGDYLGWASSTFGKPGGMRYGKVTHSVCSPNGVAFTVNELLADADGAVRFTGAFKRGDAVMVEVKSFDGLNDMDGRVIAL